MDRRLFLKIGASGLVGSLIPSALLSNHNISVYSGWIPSRTLSRNFIRQNVRPFFTQQASKATIGSGKGRVVLLYEYLERAVGEIHAHDQAAGDCVGHAYGFGVDVLAATQIYGVGLTEKWVAKASTEAIYAGSRYEIGYKVYGAKKLLEDEGSRGAYGAEYLRDYGVLVRKKYGDINLTKYSEQIAKDWGKNGVPDELEPVAKEHPIRSFALVRSYSECRDAIVNGYPVVFCSPVGFNPDCKIHNPNGRDKMGFLNECGEWFHSMCGIAVDDTERPGILLMNSWGNDWVSGPKRHNQPEGSFWVDAKTIDKMCSYEDSFAISGFIGFPAKMLNYDLF